MSTEPLLRVEGLTKHYGGPPVLRGVALRLDPGEGQVLLGPNGAGKSTLLRVLAGLQRPTGGEVWVDGRRLDPGDPEQRRTIGFLSHDTLLYSGLSARENLRFVAELFGLSQVGDRCEEVLEEMGLSWVGERPVRTFSRGMLQRLSLARTQLHRPRVLLLDEPLSGLDPAGIRTLERTLVSLRDRGTGILMTTHDLGHVAAVATRLVFLDRGRITEAPVDALGSPGSLERAYDRVFLDRMTAASSAGEPIL